MDLTQKIKLALLIGVGVVAGKKVISFTGRKILDKAMDRPLKTLMEDPYDENLWELVSSNSRLGIQNVVETKLRAHRRPNYS